MSAKPQKIKIAGVLPKEAAEALYAASQVHNTEDDPRARQKAIEHTTADIKLKYPQFFKEEPQHEDNHQ